MLLHALWPWCLTFAAGQLGNFRFFTEIIYWAPWISQVESIGLPTIFLRAQPWMIFIHLPKFSQLSPNFKEAVKNVLEAAKKPTLLGRSLVFLDGCPSLGHVISRTWPIKVPFIDISGYTEKFACLRCEQGCKNRKLVMKNFHIFCKHRTPFLVAVWIGPYVKTWSMLLFWFPEF